MSWRSLVISNPSRLMVRNGNLLIKQEDEEYKIPAVDVATVVLEDGRTSVTKRLLEEFALNKTALFVCDSKHLPIGVYLPFGGHSRQLKVLKTQLNLSMPFKKRVWQQVVKGKIENQARVLELLEKEGSGELFDISKAVKSGDKGNLESFAARLYFRYLFGKGFYRGAEDAVNGALNYGYAIMRGAVARSLVKFGFLPVMGIHHRSELNPFNLADDFIEPFRPVIDIWTAVCMVDKEELEKEERGQLVNLVNVDVKIGKKKHSVLNAIDETIMSFSRACDEGEPSLIKLPELLGLEIHRYE